MLARGEQTIFLAVRKAKVNTGQVTAELENNRAAANVKTQQTPKPKHKTQSPACIKSHGLYRKSTPPSQRKKPSVHNPVNKSNHVFPQIFSQTNKSINFTPSKKKR